LHGIKKLALNPYLSKIGLAVANWLFHASPNVIIATLLSFSPVSLKMEAWFPSDGGDDLRCCSPWLGRYGNWL